MNFLHPPDDRIPVSSLDENLGVVRGPESEPVVSTRLIYIAGMAVGIGALAALIAVVLMAFIGLVTNIFFYGRISLELVSPAGGHEGAWLLLIPVLGGLIVGLLARFGSVAIRGHGIPEVMENILQARSRIPARMLFLKPISAAIAIGTGGPFGAEGPIIATGGALGSQVGQWVRMTADERKTLLAAGAAAGMAATFGSPVSAVLLAIELLLFEYRPRSVIPVALAASAATAVRIALLGSAPAFAIPAIPQPSGTALALYAALGVIIGVAAVIVSRAVFWIEDAFEHLPIHWMWWPAIGAIAVGVIGMIEPRTLGIGYQYIEEIASGKIIGIALITFVVLKFLSWSIYLGSGTSGGTLAPLMMMGGGLGASVGALVQRIAPSAGMNISAAAIVGMAAMFAGASHALLASVVFAFETTRQAMGLLPILAGSSVAYLISLLLAPNSIMTEKLVRRGRIVPKEYSADFLAQVAVRDVALKEVVCVRSSDTFGHLRAWLQSGEPDAAHQGFPVVDDNDDLVAVITRRDIVNPANDANAQIASLIRRAPAVAYEDNTLREAADHMVREAVGRLPVVAREDPTKVIGIISRSDLLSAHHHRITAASNIEEGFAAKFGRRFPSS